MNQPARARRGLLPIAVGSYALAFAVRLAWMLSIQSPFGAVYSDMAGYVDRAERLLWHMPVGDPRLLTLFPPGAHLIFAAEFFVFGRHAERSILIVHALVAAIPAACIPTIMYRLVPSRVAAALAGLTVALWEPQICFAGFFSTEIWFSAAIAAHVWLTGRPVARAGTLLSTGAAAITAIVVRPQFLLTWAIDQGARSLHSWWRRGFRFAAVTTVWMALPVGIGLAATSVRFHALTGRWGLISASGLNRVWADTDICQINASWPSPDGGTYSYWFSPPSKPAVKPSDTVSVEGFIADPQILDRLRAERTRGVPLRDRIARKIGNVRLLLLGNLPWPESNYHDAIPWLGTSRLRLGEIFRDILLNMLPLALVGLAFGRRNATLRIIAANVVTVIVAAAFFFGEARYHVPYDPFVIVLAITGVYALAKGLRRGPVRWIRVLRSRRRSAARAAPAADKRVSCATACRRPTSLPLSAP